MFKKKKKKEKKKKPWTTERLTKIVMPIIVIVVIVFGIFDISSGCGFSISEYAKLAEELSKDFDYTSMLTDNKIQLADYQTLYEEIGPNGADLNIFVDGEVNSSLYTGTALFSPLRSFSLSDCEIGALCNRVINTDETDLVFELLEFTIYVDYSIDIVAKVDVNKITNNIPGGLNTIKYIYTKSSGKCKIENNKFVIFDVVTQVNDLSKESNDKVISLINYKVDDSNIDVVTNLVSKTISDFNVKTGTNMLVWKNLIEFKL